MTTSMGIPDLLRHCEMVAREVLCGMPLRAGPEAYYGLINDVIGVYWIDTELGRWEFVCACLDDVEQTLAAVKERTVEKLKEMQRLGWRVDK